MSILKFLGLGGSDQSTDTTDSATESVRKIARKLEEMDPVKARYIAAFAYLLGRVAHADDDISEDETRIMEQIVMERAKLPEEQAVMVIEMAKRQNRLFGHIENFLVTREFNELATRDQKLYLLDCLFALSSVDRSISVREDREIRQIASELLLQHDDFIRVRSRYREHLDILKKPGDESSRDDSEE
ncbi:MAG TPA: TerB family tellurite resistance protein [Acidobacteriota bacterium]|nr:TerB family tellurite resistance protein [Acidobacteriota bacterium]